MAAIFKRAGLAERTGRGVDLIYEGLVKFGRPVPRYDRSGSNEVIVDFNIAEANLQFVELVTSEQNKRGEALPLNALLVLHGLLELRRGSATEIAEELRVIDLATVSQQLELLVESGLVQAHGVKKGRTYTLSADLYSKLGKKTDYVRQAGIDVARHKGMVLTHVDKYTRISRKDGIELLRIADKQATRLLGRLVEEGELMPHGERKGRYYTRR